MVVTTTEAANILNISSARLRVLLIEGRVEGAYKCGKMWLIPLHKGKPIIARRKKGPTPKWRNPRKPAKTTVHVNTHKIKHNHNHQDRQPVIAVKKGNSNLYGKEILIPGGCRIIYSPDNPLNCGARVWIESLYEVQIIS